MEQIDVCLNIETADFGIVKVFITIIPTSIDIIQTINSRLKDFTLSGFTEIKQQSDGKNLYTYYPPEQIRKITYTI